MYFALTLRSRGLRNVNRLWEQARLLVRLTVILIVVDMQRIDDVVKSASLPIELELYTAYPNLPQGSRVGEHTCRHGKGPDPQRTTAAAHKYRRNW
jgi:hypothetical protein